MANPANNIAPKKAVVYYKKIVNWGWDQSDKFVKIYATSMNGIDKLPAANVTSEFTDSSFVLKIVGYNASNHELSMTHLAGEIDVAGSYHRVKSDMVVVFLKKTEGKTWSHITDTERKVTEAKDEKKKMNDEEDPEGNMMQHMLRQMYDDGDDERKRSIQKHLYEQRQKERRGEVCD